VYAPDLGRRAVGLLLDLRSTSYYVRPRYGDKGGVSRIGDGIITYIINDRTGRSGIRGEGTECSTDC
jgi:hypothetical protein